MADGTNLTFTPSSARLQDGDIITIDIPEEKSWFRRLFCLPARMSRKRFVIVESIHDEIRLSEVER